MTVRSHIVILARQVDQRRNIHSIFPGPVIRAANKIAVFGQVTKSLTVAVFHDFLFVWLCEYIHVLPGTGGVGEPSVSCTNTLAGGG